MVQSLLVRLFQRLLVSLRLLLVIVVSIFLLGSSSLPPATQLERVRFFTRQIEFDFVGWTVNALKLKFIQGALGTNSYLSEYERHRVVVEYLKLIQQIQQKQNDLRLMYSDPSVSDPRLASASLRSDLDALYARRDQLDPLAESILQSQINYVAAEMGLTLGGQTVPPVMYHSTPLPLILIISPRNIIRLDESVALSGDLAVDKQVELENNVDHALNVSSLVESIGGLGLYPTMVVESSDMDWLSEVVSHEWVHNYLTLRPLGLSYEKNAELRVMNETTASLAGKEIGRAVLERFYPELVPPPPALSSPSSPSSPEPKPPAFDFNKEMHVTRVHVDELLAEGKIDEAESYMDARRLVFWDHGYRFLRKLNQAYFAFHGAYADVPGGAAGSTEDPVGSAVRALRAQSSSLSDFLNRISWMSSFEQLQQAVKMDSSQK